MKRSGIRGNKQIPYFASLHTYYGPTLVVNNQFLMKRKRLHSYIRHHDLKLDLATIGALMNYDKVDAYRANNFTEQTL
ncbi:hypothetical protein [Coxiella burnetii]|uniref:hypothetical protein n=1 Tax=Coxiella burnetii TaxID=777 RepID=UPI00155B2F5D